MFAKIRKPDIVNQEGELLLKNARIWQSEKKELYNGNILLTDGKISEIGNVNKENDFLDLKNNIVIPGLIDMHTHLREPGFEEKETIETGTNAALTGGFTGVCCMPNTKPAIDSQEIIQFIKDKSSRFMVDVFIVGSITKGRKGEELAEIGEMVQAGIVGISDDGDPVKNSALMRKALEYTKMFDIPIISHAEDPYLSAEGVMNEGFYSTKLGLKGIPPVSEEVMISRELLLTDFTKGKLHVTHVSTKGSVELIRQAKEKGINVTCDATPHHFSLSDASIQSFDPNFKMNPPLRTEEDIQAIKDGLRDGTIDAIATDHAPHTIDDKELEFDRASFGILGLETAVGVTFKYLYDTKILDMQQIIEKLVINPRKILKLGIPEVRKGVSANFTILNPDETWTVTEETFFSKSRNSPYTGADLKGKVIGTFNRGKYYFNG